MRIFPCLDDWLIRSQSRGEALRESAFLISYATRLGLKINQEESSRLPSQQIVFSGIQLDSRLMVATPSQQRVNNTLKLISHFRRGRALALKSYLRLLGMLTAASSVVPLGLLSLRPLQIRLNDLGLHPTYHRHKLVRVTSSCLAKLRPWRGETSLTQGVPLGSIPSRREVVATDASLAGWGAVWQCRTVRGLWSPWQQEQHKCIGAAGCSAGAQTVSSSAGRKACPGRNSQHISGLPGRPPGEHKVQTILEADPTAVVVGVSSMHLPGQCICQAFKTRPRICYPGSTHLLGNGGCIHKWWKQPGRDRARQGWIFSPHSRRRTVPSGFLGGNL